MNFLLQSVTEHAVLVVFVVVLLEQGGLPLPALPAFLLAGSLAAQGEVRWPWVLAAAVAASVIADAAWYAAGRRHGRRILRLMCRLSLTPDKCVRQTETLFSRWGAPSLLVAKFIPGFASIATALAGTLGVRRQAFLVYDTLGAALWAGTGLALGMLFADAVSQLIETLEQIGKWGMTVVLLALAAYVAKRWWQRDSFSRKLRMERITVADLRAEMARGTPVVLVDAQSPLGRSQGTIPGALLYSDDGSAIAGRSAADLLVVYCGCPGDAGAVHAASRLRTHGYVRALPLQGGIDAWVDAGGELTHGPAGSPAVPLPG